MIGGGVGGGNTGNTGDSEQSNMPLVAVPADDATMETLLNGGKSAYFSFVQSNQGRFKAALGLSRG